jgi:heat shock protein HslJ
LRRPAALAAALTGFSLAGLPAAGNGTSLANAPGAWLLQSLDGQPFAARATLEIGADGRLGGEAPCNAWFARGTPETGFLFPMIGATERACDALALEEAFFAALAAMQVAETGEGLLILRGEGHEMVFVPLAP